MDQMVKKGGKDPAFKVQRFYFSNKDIVLQTEQVCTRINVTKIGTKVLNGHGLVIHHYLNSMNTCKTYLHINIYQVLTH